MPTLLLRSRIPLSAFTTGIRLLVAAAVPAASALAADLPCKFLADATTKNFTVPTHVYSTETGPTTGGKTRNSETIYLTDKIYVQLNGRWRVSPLTPAMMRDAMKEGAKDPDTDVHATCRQVRDEAINGEAATLYSEHTESKDAKTDAQAWVSKSRGLLLKLESDTELTGSTAKVHRVMRYEYTNVQVPPGVR